VRRRARALLERGARAASQQHCAASLLRRATHVRLLLKSDAVALQGPPSVAASAGCGCAQRVRMRSSAREQTSVPRFLAEVRARDDDERALSHGAHAAVAPHGAQKRGRSVVLRKALGGGLRGTNVLEGNVVARLMRWVRNAAGLQRIATRVRNAATSTRRRVAAKEACDARSQMHRTPGQACAPGHHDGGSAPCMHCLMRRRRRRRASAGAAWRMNVNPRTPTHPADRGVPPL
jgi:hypothetical protein